MVHDDVPATPSRRQRADTYLANAIDAARWIVDVAVLDEGRRAWPVLPGDPAASDASLYGGETGVALFLADLFEVTNDEELLDAARDAATFVARDTRVDRFGLYFGRSGMALATRRVAEVAGDDRLREASRHLLDEVVRAAIPTGAGVEWPVEGDGRGPWNDLYKGTAGIGLALLELGRTDLAVAAGRRLVELAIPADTGCWWRSRPDDLRPAPNIAHGTAGVAFFLATLALATGDRTLADTAKGAASYLLSIARTEGDTCAVYHHEPDGMDLYTLGWCSGPPGLASLFLRLHQLSADATWLDWATRAARTLTTSGIPSRLYPGFWDNVAQCCGSAGVADFFLGMHAATQDDSYLEFALTMLDDIVDRATQDASGTRWHNIEHTVDPPELPAQTGYMQGSSGIATALLRGHRALTGRPIGPWLASWPFGVYVRRPG